MKLRPTATLAIVGWYLLLPHYRLDGSLKDKAPLSKWKIHDRYDSRAACEAVRQELLKVAQGFLSEQEKRADLDMAPQTAVLLAAQCVATDDPRLKK